MRDKTSVAAVFYKCTAGYADCTGIVNSSSISVAGFVERGVDTVFSKRTVGDGETAGTVNRTAVNGVAGGTVLCKRAIGRSKASCVVHSSAVCVTVGLCRTVTGKCTVCRDQGTGIVNCTTIDFYIVGRFIVYFVIQE